MRVILGVTALVMLAGCGPKYIETTAVAGLERQSLEPVMLIPFTAQSHAAGELRSAVVAEEAAGILTGRLHQKLLARKVKVLLWEGSGPVPDEVTAREIGRERTAPVVLVAVVIAYTEREGSAGGIRRPASVGFTLRLIRSEDGATLWTGRYHETQKALLDDLTTTGLFINRRGRWLTAQELAEDGLDRILAVSPWSR